MVMAASRGYEADEEEDWVLDSLDRYERLHVFELQEPTLCIEWSHDSTAIFVAGFSQTKHNEFLQLHLPEKLLATDKQTLLARRDFRIGRGALSKTPIHHIRCVDQERNVVVTSGLRPELTVWGPDTGSPDLFVVTGNVTTPTPTDPDKMELPISWSSSHPQYVVSGGTLRTLQVTDISTLQPLWSSTPKGERESSPPSEDAVIHALESLSGDSNTFLTCSNRGELMLWDARTPNRGSLIFTPSPAAGVKRPTADGEEQGAHGMVVCGDKCATLSDSGRLNVYDRRGASSWLPLASSDLHSSESVSSWSGFKTPGHQPIRPCVQISQSSNELSVSGPGRGVAVYDIISWSNDIIDPLPVFHHKGHEEDSPQCRVIVHSRHPSFHSMILSCDSQGTLHAWQWRK